jgi:hypothetical protein
MDDQILYRCSAGILQHPASAPFAYQAHQANRRRNSFLDADEPDNLDFTVVEILTPVCVAIR